MNYYIDSKNGNDANSGVDWTNARNGIGSTYDLATSGDTLILRGAFNEDFLRLSTNKSIIVIGDGKGAILNNRFAKSEGGAGFFLIMKNIIFNSILDVNNSNLTLEYCTINSDFKPICFINARYCYFNSLGFQDDFRRLSGIVENCRIKDAPFRVQLASDKIDFINNYFEGLISISNANEFVATNSLFQRNIFSNNSMIRFATGLSNFGTSEVIVSDSQINNKYNNEIGSGIIAKDNKFKDLSFNIFNFPISEIDSQINQRTVGSNNYALSLSVANDEYTIQDGAATKTANYLELTTVGSYAVIRFSGAIPGARKVKRVVIHYEQDSISGETLIEGFQKLGYNHVNSFPTKQIDYKSGFVDIGNNEYGYYILNKLGKNFYVELSIQSTSTIGTIRIFGVTIEFFDNYSLLPTNHEIINITQPDDDWIETDYQIKRPDELKDNFSVPSKENYSRAEIITEAALPGTNISIQYRDDNPSKEIQRILIADGVQKIIKTFK